MVPRIPKLKVMLFNAENLFLLSDSKFEKEHLSLSEASWQKLSTSIYENKPLSKLKAIQKIIETINPDLILFCEVGGLESLRNFNTLFLSEQFSPALIEGNSDRNIDVGFLVRKNLGFYFDLISNKNRSLDFWYPHELEYNDHFEQNPELPLEISTNKLSKLIPSHRFSRDVVELRLFENDPKKPFLIFLLTHLKSRLDPQSIDPNGFSRRQAELNSLISIYEELENEFNFQVPIAVCGDFNGQAIREKPDQEFKALFEKTSLRDVCDLAQIPIENRATFYQVSRSNKSDGKQIDFAFLSPRLQAYLVKSSVQVYRYINHLGVPLDPPKSIDAKSNLPSDHYPLIFELENIPLRTKSSPFNS